MNIDDLLNMSDSEHEAMYRQEVEAGMTTALDVGEWFERKERVLSLREQALTRREAKEVKVADIEIADIDPDILVGVEDVQQPKVEAKTVVVEKQPSKKVSKIVMAVEIYKECNGVRKDCIAKYKEVLGMSPACASTYYQNAKKRA